MNFYIAGGIFLMIVPALRITKKIHHHHLGNKTKTHLIISNCEYQYD